MWDPPDASVLSGLGSKGGSLHFDGYLMSALLTKKSVRTFVKRSLGEPTIKVELDNDVIDELCNQALATYGTFKPFEKFGSLPVLAGTQKYALTFAQVGRGIIEYFRPDLLRGAITLDQFDVFKYHTHLPNLDPGDFHAERMWWKEVRRSAGADDWEEFIPSDTGEGGDLYISPIPSTSYTLSYIYVVDPTLQQVPGTDDDWIKEYTLAMSMETLGRIRRKFGSIQGAESSIDMDGEQLVGEGGDKRRELEEYVEQRGALIAPLRG